MFMSQNFQTIGIAVVEHHGSYLVGRRGTAGPLADYAEFPGGKCLPQEVPAACAVRECHEETGLAVKMDELLLRRKFQYEHATVDLHFWRCSPVNKHDIREEHNGFRWINAKDLAQLRFPEANVPLIEMLIAATPPADHCP